MQNSTTKQGQRVLIWMGGFAPIGGIETFVADLGQAAIKAGFQVDMLAWDRRSEFLPPVRAAGVRLYNSPWRWGCRWAIPDWLVLPLGILLCRKADVVVFPKTLSPLMQRLVNRFGKWRGSNSRFVYVTPYRPSEFFDNVTTEAGKKTTRELLASFDLIICQNAVFADDLRALGYDGPLQLSPYLPPNGAGNPAPYPKDTVTLGFLGRLEHQKNLPELLKVFALLKEEVPGIRLRLIGDGSLKAELVARAHQLGLTSQVEFCGAVPRDRISAAIRSCQLFCFTSHSEGQPIASLEILSEGRPIIATAVGAFPDMLADPALGEVVPLGDTHAFLDAVKRMVARQKGGFISPEETVRAYRAKFDRETALLNYMEALSPKGPAQEAGAGSTKRDVNLVSQ